jgi:hypothetical protein
MEHHPDIQPMSGPHRTDEITERIDTFFDTESRLTEEDKLRYGLKSGVEHGILTQDDADECERAFLATRNSSLDVP